MLFKVPFVACLPSTSKKLELTLISLEDWSFVTINGMDTIKYLQGQLTYNLKLLDVNRFSITSHCNAKGKVLGCLHIFHYRQGLAYIERSSICDEQIDELKKYAIFSKISIEKENQIVLLGLAGYNAKLVIKQLFGYIPDINHTVAHFKEITLLYYHLPLPRFLLITTVEICNILQYKLKNQIKFNDSKQWLALDIESGYPIIDQANIANFIPQAINIHALGGISFDKGCYLGQEIIARAQFRRINKQSLYWLQSKKNSYIPNVGDSLEIKIGNDWRRTGKILATCELINNNIWIQAVLNKNLPINSILRIYGDKKCDFLFINPLPYIVN